jgi:hypothetical protein
MEGDNLRRMRLEFPMRSRDRLLKDETNCFKHRRVCIITETMLFRSIIIAFVCTYPTNRQEIRAEKDYVLMTFGLKLLLGVCSVYRWGLD